MHKQYNWPHFGDMRRSNARTRSVVGHNWSDQRSFGGNGIVEKWMMMKMKEHSWALEALKVELKQKVLEFESEIVREREREFWGVKLSLSLIEWEWVSETFLFVDLLEAFSDFEGAMEAGYPAFLCLPRERLQNSWITCIDTCLCPFPLHIINIPHHSQDLFFFFFRKK